MEQETLFTSSKWDILKCLETGKKSPFELAKEANTSVANISQQLRLLELAGFVKSERISNREKGLPRILYSLSENYGYLVISSSNFVNKKFAKFQDYQKTILKIWFIENTSLHYYVEKYYWTFLDRHLDKIDLIALDFSDAKSLKVIVVSENSEVKKQLKNTTIDGSSGIKNFDVLFMKESEFKKNILLNINSNAQQNAQNTAHQNQNYCVLYDPKNITLMEKKQ